MRAGNVENSDIRKNPVLLLPLVLFTLLAKGQSNYTKLENELIKADKAWSHAAKTNDMEKLWSYWEEDGIILMSANMTIKGMDQIREFTTKARTDPNFEISWEVQGVEVSEEGDMGYTFGVGKVQRTSDTGKPISSTKPYLAVWKKQSDGSWKCVIEN